LIFNGAIILWNNYLPVLRKSNFYELILPEAVEPMQECFEAMNNCFTNASFNAENVDYNLDTKMNTFSNFSMMLSRIHEFKTQNDEAIRICDILLQKQLPSHLRKTFDSIKARITKQVAKGGAAAGGAPAKGAKDAAPASVPQSQSEILTSEVISLIELISTHYKNDKQLSSDNIKKAMETLTVWTPCENEEIELELHAELWCKLGRLACDVGTNAMVKVALYCAETVMKGVGKSSVKQAKDLSTIPPTRLRWYAVAETLNGESIAKLVDTEKQERESQDKLLLTSVSHFVEACNIATKASLSFLLIETVKLLWNSLLPLLDTQYNRKKLI
jgi:hypothetical protein